MVGDQVVQRHAAEVADRVAPAVEQDRHHRDAVPGEDLQPGLEVGQEAFRVALVSFVRQPPAGDVPAREIGLAPGDLDRHLPVIVVLPQVQSAGSPGTVVVEAADVLALHADPPEPDHWSRQL